MGISNEIPINNTPIRNKSISQNWFSVLIKGIRYILINMELAPIIANISLTLSSSLNILVLP